MSASDAEPTPTRSGRPAGDTCTTLEVARLLGLAVRSVQLMVDRGELDAWKTPGGHRRISRASVERWMASREAGGRPGRPETPAQRPPRVLLIEDSAHFQNLTSLLMRQHVPGAELHVADDGIAGLALYGALQPDVLIVDILLPGIDGATLITSLRSHPQFARSRLIVVTSLAEGDRGPYAFALQGVPVVHKPRLVMDLPPLLTGWLPAAARAAGSAGAAPLPGAASSPAVSPTRDGLREGLQEAPREAPARSARIAEAAALDAAPPARAPANASRHDA